MTSECKMANKTRIHDSLQNKRDIWICAFVYFFFSIKNKKEKDLQIRQLPLRHWVWSSSFFFYLFWKSHLLIRNESMAPWLQVQQDIANVKRKRAMESFFRKIESFLFGNQIITIIFVNNRDGNEGGEKGWKIYWYLGSKLKDKNVRTGHFCH